jgi:MipA family protein
VKLFKNGLCLVAIIMASSTAAPAFAQDAPDEASEAATENHVTLGAGALIYRSPFKGEGSSVFPIPVVSIRQGILYADGLEAGARFDLVKDGPVRPSIDAFVAARAIAGKDREKITADVGARVSLASDLGTLSFSYRHDATGTFDGSEAVARYEVEIPIGPINVVPGAQASWLDRKTADHMYGISPKQHQKMIDKGRDVVLPVYEITDDSVNLGGDITLTAPLTNRLTAIGYLSGTYLGKSIRANPGLRDEIEGQALVGLAYRL